jgi:xylulokinase
MAGPGLSYQQINAAAASVAPGSEGLLLFPFGNGAERMLNNQTVLAHIHNIDLNKHSQAHMYRASQEGIAFAFRYGLDIMRANGMHPRVIRAGMANMFLSDVFTESFVNTLNVPVELYQHDGSTGAAIGAGLGAGIYHSFKEAFQQFKPLRLVEPTDYQLYDDFYNQWLEELQKKLKGFNHLKENICQ